MSLPRSPYLMLRLIVTAVACLGTTTFCQAGHNIFRNNAVGGISIDAQGVVNQPSVEARQVLVRELAAGLQPVDGALRQQTEIRMISLKMLEQAIADAQASNLGNLPDDIKYLAGIQRIEYVFVYPEANDIVLAGPGEGWRVNEFAEVVGETTGRPVIELNDLLVALRTAEQARDIGISCSIDPNPDGVAAMQRVVKGYRRFDESVIGAIEQAMGPIIFRK